MSRPQDDGQHYINLFGPPRALAKAQHDLLTADERMNGDATYKAHCELVAMYIEGYIGGFVDCNYGLTEEKD